MSNISTAVNALLPFIHSFWYILTRSSAFQDNNLTSIIIPSSVTEISGGAFDGNQLTKIVIEGKSSLSEFTDSSGLSGFEDIITFNP